MAQIVRRGDNRYLVRVFLGRDARGRAKTLNKTIHGNKKAATAWAREQETRRDLGSLVRPTKQSLNSFLDEWLEMMRPNIRLRTFQHYEWTLNRYVRPVLGESLLSEIQTEDIQRLYNDMTTRGLSARSVQIVHLRLSSALRFAVESHRLLTNPAHLTKRPQKNTRPIKVFTEEEARAFLLAAQNDSLYALFLFALSTGARPEEYLALQWQDVDLALGTARIHKAMIEDVVRTAWFLEDVKTANGRRVLNLPPSTTKALRAHRTAQLAYKLTRKNYNADYDFVFAAENGAPVARRNVFNRHMTPTLKRAGLSPQYHLYCLRHTFATLALARGVDIKTVSAALGHSSAAFTLDTYCKVLPSMAQAGVDAMESALFGKPVVAQASHAQIATVEN